MGWRMLNLLYSDEFVVVANKPTRLLTVPGKGPDKQDCLYRRVCAEFSDARVVHRLDMDTSGIILFARTAEAQRNLSMQFERRETQKRYVAVVEGLLKEDRGQIEYPLRKDMSQHLPPKHLVDCIRGKKAITEWQVKGRGETTTRVELFPKTGRSHQLRVHMQSLGHPIVGDPIYGHLAARLMLHAEMLAFHHPQTGNSIQLECPAPF